jgi:hypothetical protein
VIVVLVVLEREHCILPAWQLVLPHVYCEAHGQATG